MANPIDQLFAVLQGLKTDAANFNRSLDEKDKREETKGDLARLFSSFGELRAIMSKLEESDVEKLREELKQLMSGQEDILEYNRDVNNILLEAKKRTEKTDSTKDKVIDNLPEEQKQQKVGSIFDNWRGVLSNVQHWIEQNSSNKIGSR